ncbi:hypothetical protein M1466_01380 [Candidatus Dependentiae bacterium]|nr:hypothetical protein [Candidatus Dependentiae bacterium]
MKTATIAIIGSGCVGSTLAYTLLQQKHSSIVLVDKDTACCAAQVADLQDAATHSYQAIVQGTFQQAGQADIAVIVAGERQKPGQGREALFAANETIVRNIIAQMQPLKPTINIIVITNPVDAMTAVALEASKLPTQQVIGTGTLVDTLRIRHAIGVELTIAGDAVDLITIGAHNDNQVVLWNQGSIAGKPMQDFPQLTTMKQQQLIYHASRKAYEIINGKGFTSFGIAKAASIIINAILNDSKMVLPVSTYQERYDCCCSMPTVVGNKGAERILPLQLTAEQEQTFLASLATLHQSE